LKSDRTIGAGKFSKVPELSLWYDGKNAVTNAIGYVQHRSRSHDAVIRLYDEAGNVIETHEQAGDFNN
jgi:hypothetical protein